VTEWIIYAPCELSNLKFNAIPCQEFQIYDLIISQHDVNSNKAL